MTPALSNFNKGNIHEAFSTNQNWTYDWREFVVIDDSNFQTAVNLWFDNQAEANFLWSHQRLEYFRCDKYGSCLSKIVQHSRNINAWDVSNVTTMYRMFRNAFSFNRSLNDWNTSSVSNMYICFMVPLFSINR